MVIATFDVVMPSWVPFQYQVVWLPFQVIARWCQPSLCGLSRVRQNVDAEVFVVVVAPK
ncbi:MAG: hypothetical protein R3F11_27740 [Verrucomicrobiales bacterium]